MKDRKLTWSGTLLVAIHALIGAAHVSAHRELGIQLTSLQNAFIIVVIGAGPILAAILLWTVYRRGGSLVLAASMAGAFVFGIYFHFFAVSPDHVSHLPEGEFRGMFRSTAVLLAVTEALGVGVGWLRYSRVGASSEQP